MSVIEISTEIPNEETIEAMQEVSCMKADPALGKKYTDVDKLIKEN